MKIVVDAMGGDYAPEAIVAGGLEAVKELNADLTFVGIEEKVRAELAKHSYDANKVEVVHASEVVEMHESPAASVRRKRDSSISVGVQLLRDNPAKYSAFISAGNTGAVVSASTLYLRLIEGVDRPAIGLYLPTLTGMGFFIDVGANTDPKPEHLLHNALMGQTYVRNTLGKEDLKVGLLNIGSEESKGTGFYKETHKLLADKLGNFVGNVEANEAYFGKCDVIVCDGYVGNILIKVSQGLMEAAGKLIKREVRKDPLAGAGALLMKTRLKNIKQLADYSSYGGAPLLGVNGIVMISHGRSSPKAVKNAIRVTQKEIEHDIITRLKKGIKV